MSTEPLPSGSDLLPSAETLAEARHIIAQSRPEDFDGHTEFHRMTPLQRLQWLDAAIVFIESAQHRLARKSTGPPSEKPTDD